MDAARSKLALSFRSTGVDMSLRYSTAFVDAFKKDSAMMVGCIPFESIFSAAPSRLPARTTTLVVPSPASISCAADRSTSYNIWKMSEWSRVKIGGRRTILAAGCKTAMCLSIVAPSLVTMTSPCEVCICRWNVGELHRIFHDIDRTILSIPLGPRDVLTASLMAIIIVDN